MIEELRLRESRCMQEHINKIDSKIRDSKSRGLNSIYYYLDDYSFDHYEKDICDYFHSLHYLVFFYVDFKVPDVNNNGGYKLETVQTNSKELQYYKSQGYEIVGRVIYVLF